MNLETKGNIKFRFMENTALKLINNKLKFIEDEDGV